MNAQSCNCATPIKNTIDWCTGAKGGTYCTKADGNKHYKPKTIINDGSCNCLVPASKTVNWCTGPRGGQFCINAKGNKIYKTK